jgi:hypothetical protein
MLERKNGEGATKGVIERAVGKKKKGKHKKRRREKKVSSALNDTRAFAP